MLLTIRQANQQTYLNYCTHKTSRGINNNTEITFKKGVHIHSHTHIGHTSSKLSHVKLPHVKLPHIKLPHINFGSVKEKLSIGKKVPDIGTSHSGTKIPKETVYHHNTYYNPHNDILNGTNVTETIHSITSFPHNFGMYLQNEAMNLSMHVTTFAHHLFGFMK